MKRKIRSMLRYLSLRKTGVRMLSMLLSLLIIFYVIPSTIFAEIGDALSDSEETSDSIASEDGASYAYQKVLYEVEELREDNVKHFHLEDGSYIAVQYDYPVHTMSDDGGFDDIDNSLTEQSGLFTNSSARIKFAKKLTGNEALFTLKDKNTKLTMSLIGAKKGTSGSITNYSDDESETELQKMLNLEKLSAKVLYADILDGVDVEYIAHSLHVKENIIVKQRSDSYEYSFELKLNGLLAELDENGNVLITNDKSGELTYRIPAPVVYDSEGRMPEPHMAYYTLDGKNGKYTLTVTVDAEWMNSEERAFPVTVDPTVSTIAPDSEEPLPSCFDTQYLFWKASSITEVSSVSKVILTVPHDSARWDSNLPLLAKAVVSSAIGTTAVSEYVLSRAEIDERGEYKLDITDIWNKWRDGRVENNGLAIYQEGASSISTASTRAYSITSSAYSATPSLAISYNNLGGIEDYYATTSHSAGNAGSGTVNLADGKLTFAIPTLTTTDSVMPYTPTLVYNSDVTDYTADYVDTVYNTSYMPYGFKLNICETVVAKTANGTTYYVYMDADGTEHAFYQSENASESNVYYDEDGLQMTMTVTDEKIQIFDSSKTVKVFCPTVASENISSGWYLKGIVDKSGNSVQFEFDSLYRPTAVLFVPSGSDVVIRSLELEYNTDGKLSYIYNSYSEDAVVIKYSTTYNASTVGSNGNYLRRVMYLCNAYEDDIQECIANTSYSSSNVRYEARYEYDSIGRMITAKDYDVDQRLEYTWIGSEVVEIGHYASYYSGEKISYDYHTGYTNVRDPGNDELLNTADDIITVYTFDERNRASSVYTRSVDGTEIYGGSAVEYETEPNAKNNIKEQIAVGNSYPNYLLNGDFEGTLTTTPLDYWRCTGSVSNVFGDKIKNGNGLYTASFYPMNGASASIHQFVFLKAGTYTLSMDCDSSASKGMTGYMIVTSENGGGQYVNKKIPLNENYGTNTEFTASATFTVGNRTDGGDKVKVMIQFSSDTTVTQIHRINIDNVMLSKSTGAARFNTLDYGGFDASGYNSSGTSGIAMTNAWQFYNASVVQSNEAAFGNVVQISANSSGVNYAKQRVYEMFYDTVHSQDYQYMVSGFAKAPNAVSGGIFRLRVDVIYLENNSEFTVSHYFDFNDYSYGWQFAAGTFKTKHETEVPQADGTTQKVTYTKVKAIDIYCEYGHQNNSTAVFDNISIITCNDFDSANYEYNDAGLVESKKTPAYREYYMYDENRNLIRVANDRGAVTSYSYDEKNRVISIKKYEIDVVNNLSAIQQGLDIVLPDSDMLSNEEYHYNDYGLCIAECVEDVGGALQYSSMFYEYEVTLSSNNRIFGALLSESRRSGSWDVVEYIYDESNGRLISVYNSFDGVGMDYYYDNVGNLTSVIPYNYSNYYENFDVGYDYNENNLSMIWTNSTLYHIGYDIFGNPISVAAGSNTIESYTYGQNNGKLEEIHYADGNFIKYVYNSLELLTEVWYNYDDGTEYDSITEFKAYSYEYTAYGQVYKFVDYIKGKTTVYDYDSMQRLIHFAEYDNDNSGQVYNEFTTKVTYKDFGAVHTMCHEMTGGTVEPFIQVFYANIYDMVDSSLASRSVDTRATEGTEAYTYDNIGRITESVFAHSVPGSPSQSFTNNVKYNYNPYLPDKVYSYESTVNGEETTYSYWYYGDHSEGKMFAYSINDEARFDYEYDALGRLIREDSEYFNRTYVYEYDNDGNITKKLVYSYNDTDGEPIDTVIYEYPYVEFVWDDVWGDKMLSVNGENITYDSMGNPLLYYNGNHYEFTWEGRRLIGAETYDFDMSFTYNDEGYRTSKTVNGVTTTYYLAGSQIIAEETNGNYTVYLYDASGSPMGMQFHGSYYADEVWDVYWFERDLLGNVVAVYDESGNKLVSYYYDAWGNCEVEYDDYSDDMVYFAAYSNPFRYRGYYYDYDLGMYYLNSRYYDARLGRFISPDIASVLTASPYSITDKNLYAYCNNDPVNYIDPSGYLAISALSIVFGIIFGAVASGGIDIGMQLYNNGGNWDEVDIGSAANSAIVGGAIGLSTALGVGYLGPIIAGTGTVTAGAAGMAFATSVGVSALAGAGGYVLQESLNGRISEVNVGNVIGHASTVTIQGAYSFAVGGMVGSVGGEIGSKGRILTKEWVYKLVLGQEFTLPFNTPVNKLRKSIWG